MPNAVSQQLSALLPESNVASLGRVAWAKSGLIGPELAKSALGGVAKACRLSHISPQHAKQALPVVFLPLTNCCIGMPKRRRQERTPLHDNHRVS